MIDHVRQIDLENRHVLHLLRKPNGASIIAAAKIYDLLQSVPFIGQLGPNDSIEMLGSANDVPVLKRAGTESFVCKHDRLQYCRVQTH
jgi:hypothetical protein